MMTIDYSNHCFTASELAWLTGISEEQFRHWTATGIIRASDRDGSAEQIGRLFTLADLVAVRAVKELREQGVPLSGLRKIQDRVAEQLDSARLRMGDDPQVDLEPARLVDEGSGSEPIDVIQILNRLVWKIEHSRELKHQIGRIEQNPDVLGGEPVVAGTRVTVDAIQAFAHAGCTIEGIREEYPGLTPEDVQAAIDFPAGHCSAAIAG